MQHLISSHTTPTFICEKRKKVMLVHFAEGDKLLSMPSTAVMSPEICAATMLSPLSGVNFLALHNIHVQLRLCFTLCPTKIWHGGYKIGQLQKLSLSFSSLPQGSSSATTNKPVRVEPDSFAMRSLEALQPLSVGGQPQSTKGLFHAKECFTVSRL